MRGLKNATGGLKTIPANCLGWDNNETAFGSKFVKMKFGRYPLNIIANDGNYANNLALGFCREASQTYNPKLVMVSKGGHPIEAFIPAITRRNKKWPLSPDKTDLTRYVFNKFTGIARALRRSGKKRFDVVIFHQGEANGTSGTQGYFDRFENLIAHLVNRGFIGLNTPIITGGISQSHEFYAGHKQAMLNICAKYPNVKFVDSDGLVLAADGIHFTGASLVTLAQRYWGAFTE